MLQTFRRPPPTYDKNNRSINVSTGPTANSFNTALTLGATLSAEHYAAFRRPPPTYDKALHCRSPTDKFKTDRTLGATLRADHYQAFRRPPPMRDKLLGAKTGTKNSITINYLSG